MSETTDNPAAETMTATPAQNNPSTTTAVIRALVVLVVVAVVGVILSAVLLPNNTTLILQVMGIVVPTTGALLAYLQSNENRAKIQALDVRVDGRLTQLLKTQGEAEHAKGVIQGADALSVRQGVDTLAASVEAANVAKQAADTAREAALQVTLAAQHAAAVLAAAVAGSPLPTAPDNVPTVEAPSAPAQLPEAARVEAAQ